jgi:hypothetical protein
MIISLFQFTLHKIPFHSTIELTSIKKRNLEHVQITVQEEVFVTPSQDNVNVTICTISLLIVQLKPPQFVQVTVMEMELVKMTALVYVLYFLFIYLKEKLFQKIKFIHIFYVKINKNQD